MRTRKLVRAREGRFRRFFKPVALAAMLAVASIMPLKNADAKKARNSAAAEVQKPEWTKEKGKEKSNGPTIMLNLFGGAHHMPSASPFIGFGGAINQKAGPLSIDGLFEISAVSQTRIVLENAAFALTAPLHGEDKLKSAPLSFTLYTYQERISGVDVSPGAALNIGPIKAGKADLGSFSLGNEVEWPGPIYAGFVAWNRQVTDRLGIKPIFIWVKGEDLAFVGGKFCVSFKINERLNADGVVFFMTDPSASELLALNWRAGISASF